MNISIILIVAVALGACAPAAPVAPSAAEPAAEAPAQAEEPAAAPEEAVRELVYAERALVTAQVGYTLAHCALQRAMGTLLDCDQISVHRVEECGSPRLIFRKAN